MQTASFGEKTRSENHISFVLCPLIPYWQKKHITTGFSEHNLFLLSPLPGPGHDCLLLCNRTAGHFLCQRGALKNDLFNPSRQRNLQSFCRFQK